MASDKQLVFIYLGIALFFNVMGMDANSFWPPFKQTLTPNNGDSSKDKGKKCNFCPSFSPCKNGKCVNKECGFTCVCNKFYVGLHCETYIKNNPWIEQNVNVGVATAIPPALPTTTTTKATTTTTSPTTKQTPTTTKSTPVTTTTLPSAREVTATTKTTTTPTTSTTTKTSQKGTSAMSKDSATSATGTIKPIISGNNLPVKSSKITTTAAAAEEGAPKQTQKDKTKNSDVSDTPSTILSTTTTTKKGTPQQEDD